MPMKGVIIKTSNHFVNKIIQYQGDDDEDPYKIRIPIYTDLRDMNVLGVGYPDQLNKPKPL